MKLIKLTPYLLTLIFITSCNSPERSVGFNDWSDDGKEYKFHLGTEASIDIVKKFDKMSQNREYENMNEIFIIWCLGYAHTRYRVVIVRHVNFPKSSIFILDMV